MWIQYDWTWLFLSISGMLFCFCFSFCSCSSMNVCCSKDAPGMLEVGHPQKWDFWKWKQCTKKKQKNKTDVLPVSCDATQLCKVWIVLISDEEQMRSLFNYQTFSELSYFTKWTRMPFIFIACISHQSGFRPNAFLLVFNNALLQMSHEFKIKGQKKTCSFNFHRYPLSCNGFHFLWFDLTPGPTISCDILHIHRISNVMWCDAVSCAAAFS